jgi:hypothetical protein
MTGSLSSQSLHQVTEHLAQVEREGKFDPPVFITKS